jgi:hypothetical protein
VDPFGFPSSGYPDFGFMLKAGCGLADIPPNFRIGTLDLSHPSFLHWILKPAHLETAKARRACDSGFLFP